MDARSLLAVLAIFFLLWLVRTWANWDSREKMALKSRQRLRSRLLDSSLGERIGKSTSMSASVAAANAVPEQQGLFTDEQSRAALTDAMNPSDDERTGRLADASGDVAQVSMNDVSDHDVAAEDITDAKLARLQARLELAEARAAASEQNDLELRRLRSELVSLRAEKSSAKTRVEALEKRIAEQQQVLEQANQGHDLSAELARLLREAAEREQQNEELRARLAAMVAESDSRKLKSSAVSGAATGSTEQSAARRRSTGKDARGDSKPAESQPVTEKVLKPLFQAPSQRDDLKLIKGIGPVMERTLNELGVTTFDQLASFTQTDIDNVSEAIGSFPGRIERDDWVGKARQFALDKSTV